MLTSCRQIVDSGSTSNPYGTSDGNGLQDWVWVPGGGSNLYGVTVPSGGAATYMNRFDLSTKTWTMIGSVGNTVTNGKYNAVYSGSANGGLYASDGNTGQIWKFNVNTLTAQQPNTGPTSDNADGARCILNTAF